MAAYLGRRFVVQSPETDFNITSNRHRNTIQAKKTKQNTRNGLNGHFFLAYYQTCITEPEQRGIKQGCLSQGSLLY